MLIKIIHNKLNEFNKTLYKDFKLNCSISFIKFKFCTHTTLRIFFKAELTFLSKTKKKLTKKLK